LSCCFRSRAAVIGALLFPYATAFVAHTFFHYDMNAVVFAGLQPGCAGAFIACPAFDGAKRLSWR